ncbi:MAG: AAA family ATPase [Anaerolineales bacterium]
MLKFHLFGHLIVEQDGQSLPLPASTQARDLLAYLALFHDRRHNRSALVGTFWPDLAEERARRALSQALWQIRQCFPNLLEASAESISIAACLPLWVDAEAFEQLARSALGSAPLDPSAQRSLEQALELYRADFLEGDYRDWALLERERLRELYWQTLERLSQMEKAAGRFAKALELAQRLSRADPLNESAHREVMRLHQLLEQPEAALRQFDLCRQTLRQELNVEPEAETLALAEEIVRRAERRQPPQETLVPAPLVGREAERAALLRFVEGVFSKLGGLVLLEGEAGVGKTRLLQELAREAEWRGAQVLWGHAREARGLKPYAPLVEAVQAGLSPLRVSQIQQVVENVWLRVVFPLLSPHPALPALETAPPLAPAQEKARLVEAITHLLEGWAGIVPLVVILEDLHWADGDTLDLLPALARRLGPFGILMLGSYRGEEGRADPQVWEALQAVSRANLLERRVLPRLDEAATGELIRRSLGLASPAPLFEVRIHRETDGNPLFILETLRALQDEGLLKRETGGGWSTPWDETTSDYAEMPLPPLVERVITRRLERLPLPLRQALSLAAVLGRQVEYPLLCECSDLHPDALLGALGDLVQGHFLIETPQAYRFSHDKVRQVAYNEIPGDERTRLHLRAARALESSRPEDAAALAYHFTQAQRWDKAIEYLRQAGEQTMRVHAYATALAYYSQALTLPPASAFSREEQFDLLAAREKAREVLGDHQGQAADLQTMSQLAQNDPARLAEVHLREAWLAAYTNQYEAAEESARQALQSSRQQNNLAGQTAALIALGTALNWHGKLSECILPLREAVAFSQQGHDIRAEAHARRALANALLGIKEYAAAKNELDLALDHALLHQDLLEQAEVLNLLGILHMERGDLLAATEAYERSVTLCASIGYLYGEAREHVNLGNLFYFQGRIGAMLESYERAITIFQRINNQRGEAQVRVNRASITLTSLGEAKQVAEDARLALEYYRRVNDPLGEGQGLVVLAEIARQQGDLETGQGHAEKGAQILENAGERWLAAQAYRELAAIEIEAGRQAQALKIVEHALAICQELGLANLEPPLIALRGFALLKQGHLDQACQDTEEAVRRLNPGIEQPYLIHYWHAQALEALGRSAEARLAVQQAYELLSQSLEGLSPEQRNASLEKVPEHRAIAQMWQAAGPRRVTVLLPSVANSAEQVEVHWTVESSEEEEIKGKVARRRHRLTRLLEEAKAQGAAPTHRHLAEVLGVGLRTIERDIEEIKWSGVHFPIC